MIVRNIICVALTLYYIILLVRIILSWVPSLPDPVQPLARGVYAVTDPLLIPLRRMIPPLQMGGLGLDLSPLLLFFGIFVLQGFVC
jgi:YggT family protein